MKHQSLVLIIISILSFLSAIILGFLNKPVAGALVLTVGAIAMGFANIDKILRFKGGKLIEFEPTKADIEKILQSIPLPAEISQKLDDYGKYVNDIDIKETEISKGEISSLKIRIIL